MGGDGNRLWGMVRVWDSKGVGWWLVRVRDSLWYGIG